MTAVILLSLRYKVRMAGSSSRWVVIDLRNSVANELILWGEEDGDLGDRYLPPSVRNTFSNQDQP
jgi:hypothetical protein